MNLVSEKSCNSVVFAVLFSLGYLESTWILLDNLKFTLKALLLVRFQLKRSSFFVFLLRGKSPESPPFMHYILFLFQVSPCLCVYRPCIPRPVWGGKDAPASLELGLQTNVSCPMQV